MSPLPAPPARSATGVAGLGAAVLLGGAVLVLLVSRITAPSFDELARIAALGRALQLSRAVHDFGASATVSSSARTIYDELAPFGVVPALISSSVGDALARIGVVDKLTGMRLGWQLLTMTAPLSLFLVVEASRGARVAVLSACLLMSMPRWTHAAAVATDGAVVGSLWLLLVALYVRSLPRPIAARRGGASTWYRSSAALFGLVLGFALATSVAVLWIVPLIVAHYMVIKRRATARALRRGTVPVPAAFLWALFLSPGIVLLLTPKLWRGGAVSAAEWLFLRLGPTLDAVTFRGSPVTADTVPAGYAAGFLVATVPVVIALFAVVGGVVIVRDFAAARRGDSTADPVGLGVLALLGLGCMLVGPALEPRLLLKYPPRIEASFPWIAAACAVGVDRLVVRVSGQRKAAWIATLAAALFLAIGLVRISTAGASFSLFVGGTRGAVLGGVWMVGDGSEVGVLGRAIDALRLPHVSLRASDIPRNYFAVLSSSARMSTKVDISGSTADLVLVRGPRSGALATADQAGEVLWSLIRRR